MISRLDALIRALIDWHARRTSRRIHDRARAEAIARRKRP